MLVRESALQSGEPLAVVTAAMDPGRLAGKRGWCEPRARSASESEDQPRVGGAYLGSEAPAVSWKIARG